MLARRPIWIQSDGNLIRVAGGVRLLDFRKLLAAIHNLTVRSGYPDITLDMSQVTAAYIGPMLAICAEVLRLRADGIDFHLILPNNVRLRNLFINTGWAHLLDPAQYQQSTFRGFKHVPALRFASATDQPAAVNRLIDAILGSMESLERTDLAAIEWSVNEIMDNVLVHSESEVGGLVQVTNHTFKRQVEFAVVDAGVGIPATLRQGRPEIRSDTEALERAIREGITRDRAVGQGNGLFGTFKVTQIGSGYFHIHAGLAHLDAAAGELHIRSNPIPFNGSLVVACMDCSKPDALGEALKFKGKRYHPFDYIEQHFEQDGGPELLFRLADEAVSFGSRMAGQPVRTKLANLVRMHPGRRIVVDFEGIDLVSSSFADEVLGKLFVELGPLTFMDGLLIRNMSPTVKEIVDRAIMQRSQTGL